MGEVQRVAYLTAGAAGMYCGSCMYDNALAKALIKRGIECLLIPVYTPIRVDGENVSQSRVFMGGINVYLDQQVPLFGRLPLWMRRWLNHPWILKMATRRAGAVDAKQLGALAESMMLGMEGRQRKDIVELCDWLQREVKPTHIVLTNLLIGGCIPELKRRLGVPIAVMLQGDDAFLDHVPEPYYSRCLQQLRLLAKQVDAFVTYTDFYGRKMGQLLQLRPEQQHQIPLCLDVSILAIEPSKSDQDAKESGESVRIGYFARLAPEKGLHQLVDAFIKLHQDTPGLQAELHVAGWLGTQHEAYAEDQWSKLKAAGLSEKYRYHGSPDAQGKARFLADIDLLCVPATFEEPKGLYVLEAFAAGVPVVLPRKGAFPELVEACGGGVLTEPDDVSSLANGLRRLVEDRPLRRQLGEAAQHTLMSRRTIENSAQSVIDLLRSQS